MAIIRKKNITFPAFRFLDRDGGLGLDTFIGTTCVADCGWSVTSVCAGSERYKDMHYKDTRNTIERDLA